MNVFIRQIRKILNEADNSEQNDLQSAIVELFKKNAKVDDKLVHKLANDLGIDVHNLENVIYKFLSEFFRGGKSGGKDVQVPADVMKVGLGVESEHTDNKYMQEKIVEDHYVEDAKYYDKLLKCVEK